MDRALDVLEGLIVQIHEIQVELRVDLIENLLRQTYAARFGKGFQTRGDVDAITINIVPLDNHITDVYAMQHSVGQEVMRSNRYYSSLSNAEQAIRQSRSYILWHNPNSVLTRAQTFFSNSRHEIVISSNLTRLEYFANIRHRIAHSQEHAKNQFDLTTMALCGVRYPGSRPGKFLRDQKPASSPTQRWLETISQELSRLAEQIGR